jgi:rhamnosyltransferase
MNKEIKISIIIVTFNPEITVLESLISIIDKPNRSIVIIDNNSNLDIQSKILEIKTNHSKIIFIINDSNLGIAKAQNQGILKSIELNSEVVVFFDHDSIPESSSVENLILTYKDLNIKYSKIGMIGSSYYDERYIKKNGFIRIKKLKLQRVYCEDNFNYVEADYVISSGSLIPLKTLNEIGLMKEELFVDYVDVEFGLRAKCKGYKNFGSCKSLMKHSLGDNPTQFLSKMIPSHSPRRHYYLIRNAILLYKDSIYPLNWKIVDGYRLLLKIIYYPIFLKPRLLHLKMIYFGIVDGIRGISGKVY